MAFKAFTQDEMAGIGEWWNRVQNVEKASLAERKENAQRFLHAMRDPKLIAERIGWLFFGNYGLGAMLKAKQVLGMNKNANKPAQLNVMVAAMEWHCPSAMAVAMWKKLTPREKATLDKAIKAKIKAEIESAE